MAGVTELFCQHLVFEDDDDEQFEIDFEEEILDLRPLFSHSVFDEEALIPPSPPIFTPNYDDHGLLSFDLFDRFPPPETLDTSDFRAFDGLELGLELELGFDVEEEGEEVEDRVIEHGEGLRVVGFESDSDSDLDPIPRDQDPSVRLRWDSLRLGEGSRDLDDDFEWEEVDERIDDDTDFLGMMVGGRSRSSEIDGDDDDDEQRNVDWEVLLAVSNDDRSITIVEDGDFINPSEYEILFGHFADHDSAIRGSPPAAKLVVENLPSFVLTKEHVANNNAMCAVCKEEILLEEKVKQLPCLHHYHGECILPWLGIRNTCPVCRYELLTDDPEYESWKAQRRAVGIDGRYDFEMFPENLA